MGHRSLTELLSPYLTDADAWFIDDERAMEFTINCVVREATTVLSNVIKQGYLGEGDWEWLTRQSGETTSRSHDND